jgi:hypothetical protein
MDQTMRYLVDGHVHFYPAFDFEVFFERALGHLLAANPTENGVQGIPFLLLSEGRQHDWFARWQEGADGSTDDKEYNFSRTREAVTLALSRRDGAGPLAYVVRGRQVVTRENLEILHLATELTIADGLPAEAVLGQIVDRGELAVLAWGVGKWLLNRGRLVDHLIDTVSSPFFFLGDNSARPWFWPRPPQFKRARERGIAVVCGSDPLPFRSEQAKPGSFGFSLEGPFNPDCPAESLTRLMTKTSNSCQPLCFGRRDGLVSFFLRQAKVNGRKHLGKS